MGLNNILGNIKSNADLRKHKSRAKKYDKARKGLVKARRLGASGGVRAGKIEAARLRNKAKRAVKR